MSTQIGGSQFLPKLARYYAFSPSVVLIRTAEAELLSAVSLDPPVLDLACGDGFFAWLICPGGIEAGCDFSENALRRAEARKQYRNLVRADVTKEIPFPDASFQTIVSNSSLEHVVDIDATLCEVARVLKPGGNLYCTFFSSYAYEWWPCGEKAKQAYLQFQPVYHYYKVEEWKERMNRVGLQVIDYQYYLDKRATTVLIWLDYHFSRVYLTGDMTLMRPIIYGLRLVPRLLLARFWCKVFAGFQICSDDAGGGILLVARRGV